METSKYFDEEDLPTSTTTHSADSDYGDVLEMLDYYSDGSPDIEGILKEFYKIIIQTQRITNMISLVAVVLNLVAFVPLLATCCLFKKWRDQEHNKILMHFISCLILHNLMFIGKFEELDFINDETVSFIIEQIEYYSQYLIVFWMFLLIFCMRKMLVQVIITKNIFSKYVYILIYLVTLLTLCLRLAGETNATWCYSIFSIVVLSMNTVIYFQIIISVTYKTNNMARNRNMISIVIRFIILYTLVSLQTIFQIINSFTVIYFTNYTNDDLPDVSFEDIYYNILLLTKSILYTESLTRIPTSLCIIYCLFGNKNTRIMWKKYFRRIFRRSNRNPDNVYTSEMTKLTD